MKRLLAIGAISVLGALMIGSAAALTVGGGTLASGTAAATSCDPDGVSVEYVLNGTGNVDQVVVSGIDAGACTGRDVIVTTTGAAGLNGICANLTATDTQAAVGVAANQPPGPISSVSVTIANTAQANANCTAS